MSYDNIRQLLGHLIGKRVLEITQHDDEDIAEGKDHFVELMFEDGNTVKFFSVDDDLYKAKASIAFSDPTVPYEADYYQPTDEEKAQGNWAVVHRRTDEGSVAHVVPLSGRLHLMSRLCWCNPRKEWRDDGSWFLSHHEEVT